MPKKEDTKKKTDEHRIKTVSTSIKKMTAAHQDLSKKTKSLEGAVDNAKKKLSKSEKDMTSIVASIQKEIKEGKTKVKKVGESKGIFEVKESMKAVLKKLGYVVDSMS